MSGLVPSFVAGPIRPWAAASRHERVRECPAGTVIERVCRPRAVGVRTRGLRRGAARLAGPARADARGGRGGVRDTAGRRRGLRPDRDRRRRVGQAGRPPGRCELGSPVGDPLADRRRHRRTRPRRVEQSQGATGPPARAGRSRRGRGGRSRRQRRPRRDRHGGRRRRPRDGERVSPVDRSPAGAGRSGGHGGVRVAPVWGPPDRTTPAAVLPVRHQRVERASRLAPRPDTPPAGGVRARTRDHLARGARGRGGHRPVVAGVLRIERAAGGGSAASLPLLPPTLSASFHSVSSTIGVGVVCAGVAWYRSGPTPPAAATDAGADGPGVDAVATGLTGTTVALAGYTLVYLLLRPDDGGVERISSERRPPCVRVPLPETPVGTIARVRVSLFHEMNKNLVYTRPIARPRSVVPFLIRESTAGRDTVGYDYVKIFDTPGHRNPSRGYSRQWSPTNRGEPEAPSGTGA